MRPRCKFIDYQYKNPISPKGSHFCIAYYTILTVFCIAYYTNSAHKPLNKKCLISGILEFLCIALCFLYRTQIS